MNYLFHAYLSGENKDIVLGGFIADGVKGNQLQHFNNDTIKGIRLHRRIDEFSNNHPSFIHSRKLIQSRYNGVFVDMYYDHFLAANWKEFSDIPLKRFTAEIYNYALKNFTILPVKIKRLLFFMKSNDWLASYADLKHLQVHFENLSKRAQFVSGMENAVETLELHYDLFEKDFRIFFSDVCDFSEKYLLENP